MAEDIQWHPPDYVSIDDFYKVAAYAYLLKSGADTVDEIKFKDITISFVSSKLMKVYLNT